MQSRMSTITLGPGVARKFSFLMILMSAMLFNFITSSPAQDQRPNLMAYLYVPVADVTNRFGTPKSSQRVANGDTILIYEWSRSDPGGGYTVSNAEPLHPTGLPAGVPYSGSPMGAARRYIPMQTVELAREARFTVGRDGQVREISWDGEGCLGD